MYEDMKEFLKEEFIRDSEEELQAVRNDPELKKRKAPDEIKQRLLAEIDAREEASKRMLTKEEEALIEIGRLYMRRRKRHKYFVLAAVLVLAFAMGLTAMGGPKKVVEEILRKVMGRTQMEIDVDSENVDPIHVVDEEVGYQTVKDKWGVDPVRMQYYPEGVCFVRFELNAVLGTARFSYEKEKDIKILYQVIPVGSAASQTLDIEDESEKTYVITVQGKQIQIKGYNIKNKENNRWTITFSHCGLRYFIWINDESQSNMEKIVKNLKFF